MRAEQMESVKVSIGPIIIRDAPNSYIRTIAGDRYVVALREIRPGDESRMTTASTATATTSGPGPAAALTAARATRDLAASNGGHSSK